MRHSIEDAAKTLAKLIEEATRGEIVTINQDGFAVAELVPVHAPKQRVRFGILAGKVPPPPDEFFEPMSEEELRDWEP